MNEEQINRKEDTFTKIIQELEKDISKLPLNSMLTHENSKEKILEEPLYQLGKTLSKCMNSLFIKGAFGDVDAIKTLRDTGIKIAEILERLADSTPVTDGHQNKTRSNIFEGCELNLKGNLSSISMAAEKLQNLFVTSDNATTITAIKSNKYLNQSSGLVRICDAPTSLFTAKTATKKKVRKSSDITTAASLKIDPVVLNRNKVLHDLANNYPTLATISIIEQIIERSLVAIASGKSREAINQVAGESLKWPTFTSALEHNDPEREVFIESLSLGQFIPFRLVSKSKPGNTRSFVSGTQTAFALEYCIDIHSMREFYRNHIATTSVKNYHERLEFLISMHESMRCEDPENYYSLLNRGLFPDGRSSPNGLWSLKAASLASFPTKTSENPRELENWLEVAMLRAERLCSGKWNEYPWWPQCVIDRARYDKKAQRVRTIKEAVKEKLRQGMQKLQLP